MPARVPHHAVQAGRLVVLAVGAELGFRGMHRPHDAATADTVGGPADRVLGIIRLEARRGEDHEPRATPPTAAVCRGTLPIRALPEVAPR